MSDERDIVERLRAIHDRWFVEGKCSINDSVNAGGDAAAEIERLRTKGDILAATLDEVSRIVHLPNTGHDAEIVDQVRQTIGDAIGKAESFRENEAAERAAGEVQK